MPATRRSRLLQPARRTWTRQPLEVEWGGLVDEAGGEAKLACLSVIDLAGRFFMPKEVNYLNIE